jgi:hypothetical protein
MNSVVRSHLNSLKLSMIPVQIVLNLVLVKGLYKGRNNRLKIISLPGGCLSLPFESGVNKAVLLRQPLIISLTFQALHFGTR